MVPMPMPKLGEIITRSRLWDDSIMIAIDIPFHTGLCRYILSTSMEPNVFVSIHAMFINPFSARRIIVTGNSNSTTQEYFDGAKCIR